MSSGNIGLTHTNLNLNCDWTLKPEYQVWNVKDLKT